VATGGVLPYRWSLDLGPVPPGLTLSTAGVISGTPTTTGTFTFTVRVTDSAQPSKTDTARVTIKIAK
jgi:Putative Ig domain